MKTYLFISKEKKQYAMYQPYLDTLQQKLDISTNLIDADVVLIVGAWTIKGAQLAHRARKMGIPYIVCPLGDLSIRNISNPYFKRKLQTSIYQKRMYKESNLILATTPMEKDYLVSLGWNQSVSLLRYFGYSHLTTAGAMVKSLQEINATTLSQYEQQKAESIAAQSEFPIIMQIMQIKSRMPHKNIPMKYLDDLHELLYADNYDEDAINVELSKLQLTHYAAAVFQAMSEKTGLTEGFMPLPAKKGAKSKEILKYLK